MTSFESEIGKLSRSLRNLEDTKFSDINKNIAQHLRNSTLERFKNQEDPQGKKWQKRKFNTTNKKLLQQTGTLRKSIKSTANDKTATVGTNLKYASTHQFGAKNRRIRAKNSKVLRFKTSRINWASAKEVKINIPARPFLGVSEEDKKEVRNILLDFLEEAVE